MSAESLVRLKARHTFGMSQRHKAANKSGYFSSQGGKIVIIIMIAGSKQRGKWK